LKRGRWREAHSCIFSGYGFIPRGVYHEHETTFNQLCFTKGKMVRTLACALIIATRNFTFVEKSFEAEAWNRVSLLLPQMLSCTTGEEQSSFQVVI